jgi:phage shock protein C
MDLKRATRDRMLLGVCGGIAHSLGWNSNLVRVIVAISAFIIPGVSLVMVAIAYAVLGFLLPESPEF